MRKGLTIMMLAGAALFGVASAANAQDYRYQGSRIDNPGYAYAQQRQRNWVPTQAQDGTAEGGNASPPAGGVGRVDSPTQE